MKGIKDQQINEDIRDREIRVIDMDGNQLGIMSAKDAQKIANSKSLDLVKIAPQARPPVCKIMDYGKYKYELAKREKEARKNQKIVDIKEIRLSANIETHDLNVKAQQANKFLKNGDKVKVSLRFRGRELSNTSKGQNIVKEFASILEEVSVVEREPRLEGRQMIMILAPKNA